MKRIIKIEFKDGILNGRFWAAVLLLLGGAVAAGQPFIRQLYEMGSAAGENVWYEVYTYCISAENWLLLVPLAAGFAEGGKTEAELRYRYSMFYMNRVGRKRYLTGKIFYSVFAGGFVVSVVCAVLPFVMFFWMKTFFPGMNGGEISFSVAIGMVISIVRMFFNGAFWAMVGSMISVIARNRYLTYAVPFILYYVLTSFQERYYSNLFFMSPRFWAAPVYYGNLFCVGILVLLNAAAGIMLIIAIRRRGGCG